MKKSYSFIIDRNLCIQSWGKKIADFTGKPAAQTVGKKYYTVIPGIYDEQHDDAVSQALKGNSRIILKGFPFTCLVGQTSADIWLTPVKDAEGKTTGVKVTFLTNLSCPKQHAFTTSQSLIDIGKMTSTLAHGVRSPLNAIKGAVTYIRERYNGDPVLDEFTRIMEDEIMRLNTFISRFLSTSVKDVDVVSIDINVLVRKIEAIISLQIQPSNISALFEYGDIPLAMADPFQIEQAIRNVINNAIEAMPQGGKLVVRTKIEPCDRQEAIVIEISDTGKGIDHDRLSSLFQASPRKGKGFGLYITREIMERFGGSVHIESKKKEGSTVRLCLPLN